MKNKNVSLAIKASLLLLSLFVMIFVGSLAWFTSSQKATADGINVVAKGDGVEVSWDGKDYFDNLTALTEEEAVDGTGYAKNLCDDEGNPKKLRLVTGNGLSFFEPNLNRRLGETILNPDGSWNGFDVTSANSDGRYIDLDLYFRSTVQRDVYLAGNSTVSPKDPNNYNSEFGHFSKDHIAAASRVAFLNADKDACSYIWAPNANVELLESESGYEKFTTTATETIKTSSGNDTNLNGNAVNDGKTYYLWTFRDELIDTYAKGQNSQYLSPRVFEYDSTIKYFVTELEFYIPTYEQNNPSIPIIINTSGNRSDLKSTDSVNIKGWDSLQNSHADQHFFIANGDFNLDNNSISCTNKMYADTQYIKSGEHIKVKFGYNPATDLVTILDYETSGGQEFHLGGKNEEIEVEVKYYPLPDNSNCVLVNPDSSIAVSSNTHNKKAVYFRDSKLSPVSVTVFEQFTAIKDDDGYKATYKFQNVRSGQYLNVTDGVVSIGATGSDFSLAYKEGFVGPLLKTGDYVIVVKNGNVMAVKESQLDVSEIVTVFTGISYELYENGAVEKKYEYYSSEDKKLLELNDKTTPMLFSSKTNMSATEIIGSSSSTAGKIVTLTKEKETDMYYTAHIVMRIWVEGTDREAKTPLAGGIFDLSFQFVSQ